MSNWFSHYFKYQMSGYNTHCCMWCVCVCACVRACVRALPCIGTGNMAKQSSSHCLGDNDLVRLYLDSQNTKDGKHCLLVFIIVLLIINACIILASFLRLLYHVETETTGN